MIARPTPCLLYTSLSHSFPFFPSSRKTLFYYLSISRCDIDIIYHIVIYVNSYLVDNFYNQKSRKRLPYIKLLRIRRRFNGKDVYKRQASGSRLFFTGFPVSIPVLTGPDPEPQDGIFPV